MYHPLVPTALFTKDALIINSMHSIAGVVSAGLSLLEEVFWARLRSMQAVCCILVPVISKCMQCHCQGRHSGRILPEVLCSHHWLSMQSVLCMQVPMITNCMRLVIGEVLCGSSKAAVPSKDLWPSDPPAQYTFRLLSIIYMR